MSSAPQGPTSPGPDDPVPPDANSPEAAGTPDESAPPEPAAGTRSRSGLGAVLQEEEFSVSDAIGGRRGIVESVLPTALFVVLFVVSRSVMIAAVVAVAVVVVLLLARIVARQSPASVLGGLLGVVIGAVLAVRSGDGSDFYWPGIVTNIVAGTVLLVSILARRPLVGLFIGVLDPRVKDWAQEPDARRVYTRATLLFAALYVAKVAVQLPLLLTGQVAALGVAKIAMGLPAFAIIAYLVWLMHQALIVRRDRD